MIYTRPQRVLHSLFALLMVGQLFTESFMRHPKPGRVLTHEQALFFEAHEFVGLALLFIVAARFALLIGNGSDIARLFPWASKAGLARIVADLKSLPRSLFQDPNQHEGAIAGSIHGFGLLLGLGLGLTGSFIFAGMNPDGSMDTATHGIKEVHEVLGTLLWIYVIGHVAMAIVHQLMGHRSLQRISPASK